MLRSSSQRHRASAISCSLPAAILVVLAPLLNAGSRAEDREPDGPISVPLGLTLPIYPTGVPPAAAEVELGKALFADPSLSADGSVSCASCHGQHHGFADSRRTSLGISRQEGTRNSPTLWNVAFFESFGWDGRHRTLEEQTLAAMTHPREMALDVSELKKRLEPKYGNRFRELFGGEISPKTVSEALASFQRTLLAGDSAFDRFAYLGDEGAISRSAKRGFTIFLRKGRCIQCHFARCEECHPFGGKTGFFTNNRFHNLGVGFDPKRGFADRGLAAVTGEVADLGAFKTPTLRNVALTAPYMHDGSLATLGDVIDHYNKGGISNPNLDPEIRPLELSDQEKRDLLDFLNTLTSSSLVPSSDSNQTLTSKE